MFGTETDVNNTEINLTGLRDALYDLSVRNPLMHSKPASLWFPEFPDPENRIAQKLYRRANSLQREFGLESTLLCSLFLEWTHSRIQSGKSRFVISPVLYKKARISKVRKIQDHFHVAAETRAWTVNPVLRHFFELHFDISLPYEVDESVEIISLFNIALSENKDGIPVCTRYEPCASWQFIQTSAVGIFNYKKSIAADDYRHLMADVPPAVLHLLGTLDFTTDRTSDANISGMLDDQQVEVVKKAMSHHLVVQGPPGTGKSHTISALISNAIAAGKSVLFVSEKKSAIDVVAKQLAECGLDNLIAKFTGEKTDRRRFYSKWKEARNAVLDSTSTRQLILSDNEDRSPVYEFYQRFISRDNRSLVRIVEELLASGFTPEQLEVDGKIPAYDEWEPHRKLLAELENKWCTTDCPWLAQSFAAVIDKAVMLETDPPGTLEKRHARMTYHLDRIAYVAKSFQYTGTITDLTRMAITASILGMANRMQMKVLIGDTAQYRSFGRVAKKYESLNNRLEKIRKQNERWKSKPQIGDIPLLIDLLRKNRTGKRRLIFRWQKNARWIESAFKEFPRGISDHLKIQFLELLQEESRLEGEIQELSLQLKHRYGILEPKKEIDHIMRLRNKLNEVSSSETQCLLLHERSEDFIAQLESLNPLISEFQNLRRFVFRNNADDSIENLRFQLQQIKSGLKFIRYWNNELKTFFNVPVSVRDFALNNSCSVDLLHARVLFFRLMRETRFESEFKSISGNRLAQQVSKLIRSNAENVRRHHGAILDRWSKQMMKLELLRNTPSSRLSTENRALRKKYKEELRIVLHESQKSRSHTSVKNIMRLAGGAVFGFQPVWMMNPLKVSEMLPCEQELFDLVIFDESSQIPLEDAIPSVARSKTVMVCGDRNQMPPSAFFASNSSSGTLLDQAELIFPSTMLKWHYRSRHPDLIRFSSDNFYDSELITIPPSVEYPVEFIKVPGNYIDGHNGAEAKVVADYACRLLKEGKKNIGIFAFSIAQELEIRKQMTELNVASESVLVENLENIQGIECEVVLISIGYGPDDNGIFNQRFGPVNLATGPNRLNVLFSRAISKMIVFTSVGYKDFKDLRNPGVEVLARFLQYAQKVSRPEPANHQDIPVSHKMVHDILKNLDDRIKYYPARSGLAISSFIQLETNRILLVDPGIVHGETKDIPNLVNILQSRFNGLKIILGYELWRQPERIRQELTEYFKAQ